MNIKNEGTKKILWRYTVSTGMMYEKLKKIFESDVATV